MYCRDTVWRGVIRKAGSRAGKFKDHEEEGMVSVCTKHNLALYVALAWDHSRTLYRYQTHNMSEGSTTCAQNVSDSYWEKHWKGELRNCVGFKAVGGSGLQLHAFLDPKLELVSPRPAVTYQ